MSTIEVRLRLKKPLLVYILAICFVIAPVANIIASMISFGIHGWYLPAIFRSFVDRIAWVDWSWLGLTMLAGFFLFKQSRWSWLLAMFSLALASAFNFQYGMKFTSHLARGDHFFPLLFLFSNLAILVILFFFRYPYLDRREAWWGMKPRYRCQLSAGADAGDGKISGTITNVSLTGAFMELTGGKTFKEEIFITLHLSSVSALKAEVVRTTERGFGMQFVATADQKKQIKKLIGSLSEPPMGDPAFLVKT